MPSILSLTEEKMLQAQGYQHIAGVDEVGRGSLAGPVMAAAVILPRNINTPWLDQIKDSKQLSPAKRRLLSHHIHEIATAIGIGLITAEIIDNHDIVKATRLAMKSAIYKLSPPADSLLIDYMFLPDVPLPQKGIKYGDNLCLSIACASIIVKVTRDQLMAELDSCYLGYGLAQHKGYGTREHLTCLHRLGPSPIHRHSFEPIKTMTENEKWRHRRSRQATT